MCGSRDRDRQADSIRRLRESDLDEADRIMRIAFGTARGYRKPSEFMGDANYVFTRWKASPASAFALEVDGRVAGSNFATRWGSFGFFGPLSLDPALWNRGFANALMAPVVESLDAWGVTHAGLFTLADSPKHIGLYRKFGFQPRALTSIFERTVLAGDAGFEDWTAYSQLGRGQRSEALSMCRNLTDAIHPGLDVTPEIRSVAEQSIGDTVVIQDKELAGFAVCHTGAGSEAGSGVCYVKFGTAAAGPDARAHFGRLLDACQSFAAQAGARRLVAGMSAARCDAHEDMLAAGYTISRTGVRMHRPDEPGFCRPEVFVIDDWR